MSDPASRMLALLSLLQARRDWPGEELARRLEISPRTVRRDVDRLRELGYRVEAPRGPAGGYRLAAGSDLPPLLFDDDQAVAAALALAVAPASGADIAESAARALATIRQLMPARLRHRVDAISATTSTGSVRADPDVLATVSEAVHRREIFRFDYQRNRRPWDRRTDHDHPAHSPLHDQLPDRLHDRRHDQGAQGVRAPTQLRPPRRVEPHAVVAHQGRWYLLGWDLDHHNWRTYRVDRIRPRSRTGLTFTARPVPGGDAAGFVVAKFRGSENGGGWPCRGSVLVAADRVEEIAPYLPDDAVLEEVGPDRCRVTLGSWSWLGLAGVLAGFPIEFGVDGPAELSEAVRDLADRLRESVASR